MDNEFKDQEFRQTIAHFRTLLELEYIYCQHWHSLVIGIVNEMFEGAVSSNAIEEALNRPSY